MKFKTTDTINLRASPSLTGVIVGKIPVNTIVDSDEYKWKAVTLPNGQKGFCAAEYLAEYTPPPMVWHRPIRADKFVLTQHFLEPDASTYPITGHHPGADYGTNGETNVPLYFCADGEVIDRGVHNAFGNYFFYYVPSVDRTFVYFHLRDAAPAKGQYLSGVQCGITGQTGLSFGIHLHIECMKGKKMVADRASLYKSFAGLQAAAEDADAFIRARIQ